VKFHLNRFLRRVRIHGGEFDTSARAMYREGVTSSLRADLRIVRRSTIERKQMSTKTTFKRIALVTVAALGFGVMSVAPSNAAINADTLTLSAATASQTTAETATSTSAVATVSFLGSELDSMSVTASLVSAPAGNTALPVLSLTETASASIDNDGDAKLVGYAIGANTAVKVTAGDSTKVTTAKFKVFLAINGVTSNSAGAATAPAVAGTYVVKLTPATVGTSGALAASTAQTLTITVTTAATLDKVPSASLSTVRLTGGDTITPLTVDTDDTINASKSATTAPAAIIKITQLNAAGGSAAESITAIVSGVGTIVSGAQAGAATISAIAVTGARVVVAKAGDIIQVYSSGDSGVSTITLTSSSGVALGAKTVTFYDTKPATATATVKKAYILAGTTEVAKVLAVVVKDAAGNPVTNATVTAAATDTTTTVGGAATCTAYNTTDKVYYCGIKGAGSTKFGKVGYTVTATGADAAATKVTTTADVTFSFGVAAKVTITGAATGTPGEVVTYTLTATDKNGLPVADQSYGGSALNAEGGALFEEVVASGWSTAPFKSSDSFTAVSGVITSKGTLPIAGTAKGTWTLSGDGTADSGAIAKAISATDIVVSTDVTNPGVDAAAAAAEEATAAANDATDAALSAAEAAEAATAMAQEAVDAVAELSASVTKLISALRAQITTLTNLVVKIQKKVKA